MNVLIVDDEPDILKSLKTYLELEEYEVQTEESARRALEHFRNCSYEIVLLDINMPEMSGLKLLREIKAIDPTTEVIMITGYNSLDKAMDAREAGASEYLLKPFEDTEQIGMVVDQAAHRIKRWQEALAHALRNEKEAVE